jgi:hypothetical protein
MGLAAVGFLLFRVEYTRADDFAYVVSSGTKQFGTLDLQTGAFTKIAGESNGVLKLTSLPTGTPPGGTLYASDSDNNLLTVNPATGQATVVGPFGSLAQGSMSLAERQDGTLFGVTFNLSAYKTLYTINESTGSATPVGELGIGSGGAFYAASFDTSGHLFETENNGVGTQNLSNLYSVNTTTGAATLIGGVGGYRVDALDFQNGTLYGFADNSTPVIISINTTTGAGTFVADIDPSLGAVSGAAPGMSSAAVPEPSGLAMLSIGIACCLIAHAGRQRLRFFCFPGVDFSGLAGRCLVDLG